MKKINLLKIILDIIMVVAFVLLFNYKTPGMLFHEVVGLAIGVVILIHCGLNWKWIKGVSLKIFKHKLPLKTRIGYILNILLLLSVIFIIVSGLLISKKLFPGLALSGGKGLQGLHISVSYFCLLLIGIHIGLHWNFVMNSFKKLFKITEQKKIYSYISRVLAVLLLTFGIYSAYNVNFVSKITTISAFSTNSGGGGGDMKRGDFKPNEDGTGFPQKDGDSSEAGGFAPQEDATVAEDSAVSQDDNTKPQENGNSTRGAGGRPQGNGKQMGGGQNNSSILGIITSYLGVISVFSIITFYVEKLFTKRKKVV